LKLPKG